MSKGIVIRFTVFLSLLLLSYCNLFSQNIVEPSVRLMFYNVENMFDIYDDSLKNDDEFLPGGLRRWTYSRYKRKISSLFKTIIAAGEWSAPDIVGLCEVENRQVIEDLVYHTNLSQFDYGIIHEDSPDPRGIDVCLIYRKNIIEPVSYRYIIPELPDRSEFTSRSVLYTIIKTSNDTIHLFINHWPSRRGGVLAGEELRKNIALMLRHTVDSISIASHGRAKIIIMGDFNSTPDDKGLSILTETRGSEANIINLSEAGSGKEGTYRYMGTWELIDQILVSEILLKRNSNLYTGQDLIKIFKSEFLLKNDPKYPGYSPYSTYSGYRYQGGYSDHLPVIIDLKTR